MNSDHGFLFRHGNNQALKAFQKAEVVYDLTERFTRRYLARGDRTIDLRNGDHVPWDKDSKDALYVRRLGTKQPQTFEHYRKIFKKRPPEVIANIAICLIKQANHLIDRLLARLEKDFLEHGSLRERVTRAMLEHRAKLNRTHQPHRTHKSHPQKP